VHKSLVTWAFDEQQQQKKKCFDDGLAH